MFLLLGSAAAAAVVAQPGVMNSGGIPYKISNPPGSTDDWKGTPGAYNVDFTENAKGEVEYFDVYGEVHTKYSQVYWTRNTPINLPPALVERFQGKVMAITGYEVDQVTHSGPQVNTTTQGDVLGGFACYPACDETDKSVPSYNAYNHHYFGWLQGADAEMYELDEPVGNVPNPTTTAFRDLPRAKDHGYPTNIVFKENPGGEYRKSYHGYPAGYAQLLHSPTQWVVEPMQIDTHNRAYDINDDSVGYIPSFMPKMVLNNMTQKGGLSPLIECPCSTRITRTAVNSSSVLTSGTCPVAVTSAAQCAAAAVELGAVVLSSSTVTSDSLAPGCVLQPAEGGAYNVVFNADTTSKATCDSAKGKQLVGPFNGTVMNGGLLDPNPNYGCTGEFPNQCTWDSPEQAMAACNKVDECQGFMCTSFPYPGKKDPSKLLCFGRTTGDMTPQANSQSWIKQVPGANNLRAAGSLGGLVNATVDHDGTTANITLQGPATVWFGVGFDATQMADNPYAIIVDGNGQVQERKLAEHAPGTQLPETVEIVFNEVAGNVRTVVLSRAVKSPAYTFPTTPGSLNVIVAVGNTPALAYHAAKNDAQLHFLPTKVDACLCQPQTTTYLTYMNKTTSEFKVNCVDEPRSDMLRHGDTTGRELPNAACNMQTYNGGLKCCAHENFLTDLEQDSLIPNKTDVYFLKWRYYFQEYKPADPTTGAAASHKSLFHFVFLIDDAVNDYEEDNARYGEASVGRISAHLKVGSMGIENMPSGATNVTFLVMTPHCHAPSCIREEVWNADTGEILCNVSAEYGKPEYGSLNEVFNEKDYVAIPPCIFGYQEGLQYPWTLPFGTNITAYKYLNNTYRHLGQMAQWTGLIHYDANPY